MTENNLMSMVVNRNYHYIQHHGRQINLKTEIDKSLELRNSSYTKMLDIKCEISAICSHAQT